MITSYYSFYNSPAGWLEIKSSDNNIQEINFVEKARDNSLHEPLVMKQCLEQLKEYFSGQRKIFDVAVLPAGTNFQLRVWDELKNIPFGNTLSYLELARKIGDEKSIRAAAHANGLNPIAIIIPCHRIIGSDGSLTGYAGGLMRKQWLLDHEAKTTGTFARLF